MIGLAHNLIGSLCRPKHLGCSGKITRAVSARPVGSAGYSKEIPLLVNDLDMDDLVAGTQLRNHIETLDRGTKDGVTGIEVMLGPRQK